VPVVQEVENAISLLQKYTCISFEVVTEEVEEEGEVMLRDADPVGVR